MTDIFRYRAGLAPAMGVAVLYGLLASGTPASAQGRDAFAVPERLFQDATSNTVESRQNLSQYLVGDRPLPQTVAARAVTAINALRQNRGGTDPLQVVAAADRIAALAGQALCPPKVARATIPDNIQLPAGAEGFKFGPSDAAPVPGFQSVTPSDARLGSRGNQQAPRGVHRPGSNNLLTSGLAGIQQFRTPVKGDGPRRVILITDDVGEESTTLSPFGSEMYVNGKSVKLGDHPPNEWVDNVVLGNNDAQGGNVPFRNQRAGVTVVETTVRNGVLELDMVQAPGRESYIVGMVVEPIDGPSILGRSPEAQAAMPNTAECVQLEEEITNALAELIEEVAPEAGPDLEAQQLPEPAFDDGEEASAT